MERNEVIELVKSVFRDDLKDEAVNIIKNLNNDELTKFDYIINNYSGQSQSNIICVEMDFLKTKLEYFDRIEKVESDLGVELWMIPDLVEKWNNEN